MIIDNEREDKTQRICMNQNEIREYKINWAF